MNNVSLKFLWFTVFICLCTTIGRTQSTLSTETNCGEDVLELAYEYPDSAIKIVQRCMERYKAENNQIELIASYLMMGQIHRIQLNFSQAFDDVWEAFMLAEEMQDTLALAQVNESMGQLYNYFGRKEESRKLLETSNAYYKHLYAKAEIEPHTLISSYFSLAMLHRWFREMDKAIPYIDTCIELSNLHPQSAVDRAYIDAELGSILGILEQPDTAQVLMHRAEQVFEQLIDDPDAKQKDLTYLVIIYLYFGKFYVQTKQNQLAKEYFNK